MNYCCSQYRAANKKKKSCVSFFEEETSWVQQIDGKFFQGSLTRSFSLATSTQARIYLGMIIGMEYVPRKGNASYLAATN